MKALQERAQDFAGLPNALAQSMISIGRDSFQKRPTIENVDDHNSFVRHYEHEQPVLQQTQSSPGPEAGSKFEPHLIRKQTFQTPTKAVNLKPTADFHNDLDGLSAHSHGVIQEAEYENATSHQS